MCTIAYLRHYRIRLSCHVYCACMRCALCLRLKIAIGPRHINAFEQVRRKAAATEVASTAWGAML
jgi:hypothetical protein